MLLTDTFHAVILKLKDHPKRRYVPALLSLVLVVAGLTACSSSKPAASGSSSSASSAPAASGGGTAATGSPITIGFFGPITASNGLSTDADYVAGIKAAINSINNSGGLNGHQLVLTTCDTQATASLEQTCARKFTTDSSVVACVACYAVANASAVLPLINGANLVDVGGNAPGAPVAESNAANQIVVAPNYVNDNTYQPRQVAAVGKLMGWKSVGVSVFNFQAALAVQPTGDGLKGLFSKLGMTETGWVPVPINASDYTPYIASLMHNNPDVIELVSSENGENLETEAAAQLGYKGFVFPLTLPLPSDINKLGSKADLDISTSELPPLSATSNPGVTKFLADAKAGKAAGISDLAPSNLDATTLQSWLDVELIAAAAKNIKGPITRASLLSAMESSRSLDTKGLLVGGFTQGKPSGFEYIEQVKNGQAVLAKSQPVCTASAGCGSVPFGALATSSS